MKFLSTKVCLLAVMMFFATSQACSPSSLAPDGTKDGTSGGRVDDASSTAPTTTEDNSSPEDDRRGDCGKIDDDHTLPSIDGDGIQSNSSRLLPWTVWVYESGTTDAICTGTIIDDVWVIVRQSCVDGKSASALTVKLSARTSDDSDEDDNGGEDDDEDDDNTTEDDENEDNTTSEDENDDNTTEDDNGDDETSEKTSENEGKTLLASSPLTDPPVGFTTAVNAIINNADYNSATGMYNVALLRVATAFPRRNNRICLPNNDICTTASSIQTGSGYIGGWLSNGDAPNGGYWSIVRVAGTATGTACEATVTPNGKVGDHPSVVAASVVRTDTSSDNSNDGDGNEDHSRMVLALLPNDNEGSKFTSICCVMNFINANVPNGV